MYAFIKLEIKPPFMMGEGLFCSFLKIDENCPIAKKKCPNFGKNTLFVCLYRLNSHLKCIFKHILEKKH